MERNYIMRHGLLAAVALLIAAVPAHAQSNSTNQLPYDNRHPMITYADVQTKNLWMGWSADCNTGRIPTGFVLVRFDLVTRTAAAVKIKVTTGPRPDVQTYLAGARCYGGAMDYVLGWAVQPVNPEPPGQFLYVLEVADFPKSQTCGYDVNNGLWCGWAVNTIYKTLQ
jgi:hypothetical protein